MYREFLRNPEGWKPPIKTRATTKRTGTTTKTETSTSTRANPDAEALDGSGNTPPPTPKEPGGPTFIPHSFPLRPGVRASLSLPEDLTHREARRLATFIDSLSVDEQAALPGGRKRGNVD